MACMAANVTVRLADEGDLPAVKALYDQYVATSIATFDMSPSALSAWQERLPRLYVAMGPELLGFAYASGYRARAAYDATVETTAYVDPEAVGRGVGRALYSELHDRLTADRVHTAVAVIALPNPASVALHEAFGYQRVGLLTEVGRKFDAWIDTAFYQRMF
jgi:L-amino acid N-acyltransferase YncA